MTTTDTGAGALRQQLVDDLVDRGLLVSPHWEQAMRRVPREAFVAHTPFWAVTRRGLIEHDLRGPERAAALCAVYSDHTLLTQTDRGGTATSSSTTPSLMATMMELLGASPGETVLEIGTGTGYNAALLAAALGDNSVTTIDVDPDLVTAARAALEHAGFGPTVVCGDGAARIPWVQPYDRLIATCGVSRIPAAWLQQVRPCGVIVATLSMGLLRLEVTADGSAVGPVTGTAAFMSLRHVGDVAVSSADVLAATGGIGTRNSTAPAIPELLTERVAFLRNLHFPAMAQVVEHLDHGDQVHLLDPDSGSWARATPTDSGDRVHLIQHGPRDLWAELSEVVHRWHDHGWPAIERYGVTVHPDGTHELWLDAPGHAAITLGPAAA